jgi:hypothetical protein
MGTIPQEKTLIWPWTSENEGVRFAVLHVLRSDCQQISAHPSERNAPWMSARLSYRTRRRRRSRYLADEFQVSEVLLRALRTND